MPAAAWIMLAVLAVSPASRSRARALAERSIREYDLGDIDRALADARAAYLLDPVPALLFNIAQANRALGRWAEAERLYRNYLRRVPEAKNRALVEKLILETVARQKRPPAPATAKLATAAPAPKPAPPVATVAPGRPPEGQAAPPHAAAARRAEIRLAPAPAAAVTAGPPPGRSHALAWGLGASALACAALAVVGLAEVENYAALVGQARQTTDWKAFLARRAQAEASRGPAQGWQVAAIAGGLAAVGLGIGMGVTW